METVKEEYFNLLYAELSAKLNQPEPAAPAPTPLKRGKLTCWECGKAEGDMGSTAELEIQHHHPVPKTRGGKRTIPLCNECHAKAHHRKGNMDIGRLTREALARKKARGEWVGNRKWRELLVAARVANIALADKFALKMKPTLDELMADGIVTYKGLADALNARGIETRSRKNSIWHATTVKNVLKRIESLKENNESNKRRIN
tara:strand:- start:3095 stop:3703 length:609 start_codon:yes stop_codon:yes gene_type:complete